MRVVITVAGTDRGRSGVSTYVRETVPRLAHELAATGGALLALGTERDFAAYPEIVPHVERLRIPASCDPPAASALWHLVWAGRAARAARADVLLLPAANRRSTAWAPLPTVGVVHDIAPLFVPRKYDVLRMTYVRQILARSLRSLDQLVAVSAATRTDLAAALDLPPDRIRVVPNGIDSERFSRGRDDAARARDRLGIVGPYVLYLSRLEHPGKNHLRLLRAFARSPLRASHRLVLAGQDWGARRLIEDETDALGVRDRVLLLGFVPDDLLTGLVGGADIVAMVGLREGFGLPALEALAAGRPVVVASTGALPEVVGALGSLCDPYSEASIASALERAARDDVIRARVLREGPAWAAGWGWDRTAAGLLAACAATIATSAPAATS